MQFAECFTRDQLHDFLLGKLPDEKNDLVAQHLDHCEICEDTIVGLESASDTLVNLLLNQEPGSNQDGPHLPDSAVPESESSPEFRAAIRRIQEFDFDRVTEHCSESLPLRQIGEYEIGERIANGGMGSVFCARHLRLEKTVAIKVLPERKMQNAEAIARFSREMKIIGRMDHPSMVRATDAGEINGTHFLVMERVEGLDLGRIVRLCGRLTPENAAEIVRAAAIGLHYAHQRDVVHRDVKPSNLMLNRDGAIKILDLGLATLGGLHGSVDELTTVGQLMGTLDYMAPEQCGNEHRIDSRTDIYGLGATLYKLLTGSAPYSSPTADTPLKKLKAMAIGNPTPILNRRPDLAPGLAAVVDQCLERDPSNRFQTAFELSVALEAFTTGHGLKGVLNQAEQLNLTRAEPNSLRHPESLALQPVNSIPKTGKSNRKPEMPNAKMGWFGKTITILVAVLAAGFLAWGGITIYLNTMAGQLVIESEIDNIKVSVVQNEKPTKQVQIEHGSNSTRLRAGKYEIEIEGETDGLVIDKQHFELKRGEQVVVKITRRESNDPSTALADPGSASDATHAWNHGAAASNARTQAKLDELKNAVAVATIKLDFASEKLSQYEVQFRAGARPKEEFDQARMEQQLAVLELDLAKQSLAAYSTLPPDPSEFDQNSNHPDSTTGKANVNLKSLDLIDLDHAAKAAAIRLDAANRRMAGLQVGSPEILEYKTNLELAELEFKSAQSRLSAAKEWMERQSKMKRKELQQQVLQAQEQLVQHEAIFEQSQKLAQKGFISASQLQADEFKHATLARQLADLHLQLSELEGTDLESNTNSAPNSDADAESATKE